ncbi:Atu4866 domain-containing protein [Rhodobacteraceae bacterium NNCM2]|nr:Atu4866 domain-containing protein [Coraliihabitans acroporae]
MKKSLATFAIVGLLGTTTDADTKDANVTANHSYVGMWVTEDGHIRHELLPNGRYVEARGTRERAYEGRYEISGNHIDYWDDTGFTADGEFRDGVLYHAGMVFHRR